MTKIFRYDSPENYHLTYSQSSDATKILTGEIVGVSFFVFVMFPAALWLFSFIDYPGSAHSGRRGFTRLIFLLPIYVRLPLVGVFIAGAACAMVAYLVRIADRRSDFVFGPEGVAHVGLFVSKSLLWGDIGTLNLVHRQRRFIVLRKPRSLGYVAEFIPRKGRSVGIRASSKLAAPLSIFQTSRIVVSLGMFGMSPDSFEDCMRFLHPGLKVTHEDSIRWN